MVYEQTIELDTNIIKMLDYWLTDNSDKANRLTEDETYTETAQFPDCIEMDIKCCGTRDGAAWTEAVLFREGCELCHTDVNDEFLGDWWLEWNGDVYRVHVVKENTK